MTIKLQEVINIQPVYLLSKKRILQKFRWLGKRLLGCDGHWGENGMPGSFRSKPNRQSVWSCKHEVVPYMCCSLWHKIVRTLKVYMREHSSKHSQVKFVSIHTNCIQLHRNQISFSLGRKNSRDLDLWHSRSLTGRSENTIRAKSWTWTFDQKVSNRCQKVSDEAVLADPFVFSFSCFGTKLLCCCWVQRFRCLCWLQTLLHPLTCVGDKGYKRSQLESELAYSCLSQENFIRNQRHNIFLIPVCRPVKGSSPRRWTSTTQPGTFVTFTSYKFA